MAGVAGSVGAPGEEPARARGATGQSGGWDIPGAVTGRRTFQVSSRAGGPGGAHTGRAQAITVGGRVGRGAAEGVSGRGRLLGPLPLPPRPSGRAADLGGRALPEAGGCLLRVGTRGCVCMSTPWISSEVRATQKGSPILCSS